jgi:hypothetical protein
MRTLVAMPSNDVVLSTFAPSSQVKSWRKASTERRPRCRVEAKVDITTESTSREHYDAEDGEHSLYSSHSAELQESSTMEPLQNFFRRIQKGNNKQNHALACMIFPLVRMLQVSDKHCSRKETDRPLWKVSLATQHQ